MFLNVYSINETNHNSLWNYLPQIGTWNHVLGLKPSQNPVWDLKPHDQDLNPAKTLLGTWTHWPGLNQAKTHSTWPQDLTKLRFLMSHYRKNSVRDKVIGKKWIYLDLERSTLHSMWGHHKGWVQSWNVVALICCAISYASEWEDYSIYFREGVEISRNWATAQSLVFWQCLGTLMAPLGVPFCLLIEDYTLVLSAILVPCPLPGIVTGARTRVYVCPGNEKKDGLSLQCDRNHTVCVWFPSKRGP